MGAAQDDRAQIQKGLCDYGTPYSGCIWPRQTIEPHVDYGSHMEAAPDDKAQI